MSEFIHFQRGAGVVCEILFRDLKFDVLVVFLNKVVSTGSLQPYSLTVKVIQECGSIRRQDV